MKIVVFDHCQVSFEGSMVELYPGSQLVLPDQTITISPLDPLDNQK